MELWWLLATLTYFLSGVSTCGTILLPSPPAVAAAVLVGFAATPLATSRYEAGPTSLAILSLFSSLALCAGSFFNMRVASAAAATALLAAGLAFAFI